MKKGLKNLKYPHNYYVYQYNSSMEKNKITTNLQQMKEPYIATYTMIYKVMRK